MTDKEMLWEAQTHIRHARQLVIKVKENRLYPVKDRDGNFLSSFTDILSIINYLQRALNNSFWKMIDNDDWEELKDE